MSQSTQPNFLLEDVIEADFDVLAGLRIAAMRDSLERIGRFDATRARERLRKSFSPQSTQFIVLGGKRIGFYALRECDGHLALDHLYIHPEHQGRGIGSAVLRLLLAKADLKGLAIKVGALRGSDSNRFYQRHGFRKISEDEWDIYYIYGGDWKRQEVTE